MTRNTPAYFQVLRRKARTHLGGALLLALGVLIAPGLAFAEDTAGRHVRTITTAAGAQPVAASRPLASTPYTQEQPCEETFDAYDLGPAQGFNAFSCGDYHYGRDIQGRLAVAGDAWLESFSVGELDPGGDVLVVGDLLTAVHGTVYGDAAFGGAAVLDPTVTFLGGAPRQDWPIDFGAACDELTWLSDLLGSWPANGTVVLHKWGGIELHGADLTQNVFELDAGDIDGAAMLTISVPTGSTVLINVRGDITEFSSFAMVLDGVGAGDVLFNLPDATDVTVRWIEFLGSLLAPRALVSFWEGNLNGTLAAGDLEGDGEFHHVPFDGPLVGGEPCDCPRFDLGPAQSFNLFACGDYTGGSDVQGTLAAAGSVVLDAFSVGQLRAGGDVLITGGDLTATHGSIWGDAIHGGAVSIDQTVAFPAGGAPWPGSPIDFDLACASLLDLSWDLADLPQTGAAHVTPWGAITMIGLDPDTNVFWLDAATLGAATSFSIAAPAGSKVLVNVTGTDVTFEAFGLTLGGIGLGDVVFNLFEAETALIRWINLPASVLAPGATVTFMEGNVEGTLVTGDLHGSGELHDYPFDGDLGECPGTEPPPPPAGECVYEVDLWGTNQCIAGYEAELRVTYRGPPLDGWELTVDLPGDANVLFVWNGDWFQSGDLLHVESLPWNALVPDGGQIDVGYLALGQPDGPDGVALDELVCSEVARP